MDFKHFSLTPKLLLITLTVGILTWVFIDHFQSNKIHALFQKQLDERLGRLATVDRHTFDGYVRAHRLAVRIIAEHDRVRTYLESPGWIAARKAASPSVKDHVMELPDWLPASSLLRSLVSIHYVLLFDRETGKLMETYRSRPEPVPSVLTEPTALLRRLSHDQVYLTNIENVPFLITSEEVNKSDASASALLMLASPLDDEFLIAATQRLVDPDRIVALVANETGKVLASDRPDLLPGGTIISAITDRYVVTGKTFFDYGSSNLQLQFASLLSRVRYEDLVREVLAEERQTRAISAALFLLVFTAIILWITRKIGQITREVSQSHGIIGGSAKQPGKGDELVILRRAFHMFTQEIITSREALLREKANLEISQSELKGKNQELNQHRGKLQRALDEISALIEQAVNIRGFSVEHVNPHLQKCYEVTSCSNVDCICYGKEAMRCWHQYGSKCCDGSQKLFRGGQGSCFDCRVYKLATSDPFHQISEQFCNLMHVVELRNKELADAYDELKAAQAKILQQEKMASIGLLAAGVAHEINNPLAFVAGNLHTMQKYTERLIAFIGAQAEVIAAAHLSGPGTPLEERKGALKIDRIIGDSGDLVQESLEGTDRIRTIVLNLKSFSRVDLPEQQLVNIHECLESTLSIVWNELKYKAVVKKEYGEIPPIQCYPQQLNQVFMNLLVNAAQAIEKNGEITVRTGRTKEGIQISISDTGCGIAQENIGRIFDPFFTTKEVGQGTGLGLSISYDIVTKQHGGEITVASEVGKGTVFTISLPITPTQQD